MSDQPFIVTITRDNFSSEVVEKSHQVPVLVDFWAEWCGPCKMLLPILTKLAQEFQGKFILAKVNSDEQQELSAQFGIRSIPTLKLFRFGQVAEELMGAQPEQTLRALLDQYIERPADAICLQALESHFNGDSANAVAQLEKALAEEPNYPPIHRNLLRVLVESGQFVAANEAYTRLPANLQADETIQGLKAKLDLGRQVANAPDLAELERQSSADPKDLSIRQQLAARYVMAEDYEAALAQYLEIMRLDRAFGDEAGKKGLLSVFALLNNQGPLVSRYRAKMSSLLF